MRLWGIQGPQEPETMEGTERWPACREGTGTNGADAAAPPSAFKQLWEAEGEQDHGDTTACPGEVVKDVQAGSYSKGRRSLFSSLLKHKAPSPKVHSLTEFSVLLYLQWLGDETLYRQHKQHNHEML